MSQQIALEVVLIVLLVLMNGVFSASEIALVSARKARLQQMAKRGNRRAAVALRLTENPDRFLSTVQIGITMIGVFAGAFGGATIADQIDERLETMPGLGPYSEAIGVGTVVLGITYLSLVLGELVPKRVALNAPERIATAVAPAMHALSRVAAPAVHLLTASTRAVLWLFRLTPSKEPTVTEEDLKSLLRIGTTAGTIGREERDIVERTFRLGNRSARSVMTPRVEVEWLDLGKPLEELRQQTAASSHDWLPVATERVDAIQGVVRAKDVWGEEIRSASDIAGKIRPPLFVPVDTSALALLQRFRTTGNHMAVIRDEFGGVEGIVTPTDLLEALVGELPETGDVDEPMIVRIGDGSWSMDAMTDLEEVKIVLGLEFMDGQKDQAYQTLGGYLSGQFGYQPRIGEAVTVGNHRFQVVDTDGRRIDRVVARKLSDETARESS